VTTSLETSPQAPHRSAGITPATAAGTNPHHQRHLAHLAPHHVVVIACISFTRLLGGTAIQNLYVILA
jgi:hypothetical protein